MAAMEKVVKRSMATVEWIEEDPETLDQGTAYFAERSQVLAYQEEKWVEGENTYIGVPKHAMSRYRMQEWGDGEMFRKVRTVNATRPCFCVNPLCPDKERWGEWLREYGSDEDMEHARVSWNLQSLHPMWSPTTRLDEIQYALATYLPIYEEMRAAA